MNCLIIITWINPMEEIHEACTYTESVVSLCQCLTDSPSCEHFTVSSCDKIEMEKIQRLPKYVRKTDDFWPELKV
jgi:hypothetical protein